MPLFNQDEVKRYTDNQPGGDKPTIPLDDTLREGGTFVGEPDPKVSPWPHKYHPTDEQLDQIDNRFSYHPPKDGQIMRYQQVRLAAKAAASVLVLHCPPSRELDLAMEYLQQAVMWANAAIACNE